MITVKDGNNDYDAIRKAIAEAKAVTDKPSLLKVGTHACRQQAGFTHTYCMLLLMHGYHAQSEFAVMPITTPFLYDSHAIQEKADSSACSSLAEC